MSSGKPRERLVSLLESGEFSRALSGLTELWAQLRDPALAKLISEVGFLSDQRQPDSVSELLGELDGQPLAQLISTLRTLRSWTPDPRVFFAMIKLLESGIGSQPKLWLQVYELIVLHADPRYAGWIEQHVAGLNPDAPRYDRDGGEGPAARRFLPKFRAACLAARRPLPDEVRLMDAASESCARIVAERLASKQLALGKERDVLASASWAQDGPSRRVFADWLEEQGEARGSFLSLACAYSEGKASKASLLRFARDSGAELKGSLSWLGSYAVEFVDGLPTRVQKTSLVEPAHTQWLVCDPRWLTVRELSFRRDVSSDPEVENEILTKAPLHSLVRLDGRGVNFESALARPFEWQLEEVEFDRLDDVDWRRARTTAVPRWHRLCVNDIQSQCSFWRSAASRQVRILTGQGLDDLAAILAKARHLEVIDALESLGLRAERSGKSWRITIDCSSGWVRFGRTLELLGDVSRDSVESVHVRTWPRAEADEGALRERLRALGFTVPQLDVTPSRSSSRSRTGA